MLVTNYHSWDCDLRTELQQELQSLFLFSKVASLILEVGKVMFSICQEEWEKLTSFILYNLLLFSFWGQFQRLAVTVGQKPEILIEEMCDFLHRGKRCLGKAGTTPERTRTLVGGKITSLPTVLGRACPKKAYSSWKKELCLAPFEGTVAARAAATPKGHQCLGIRDHSQFRVPVGGAGVKPCGTPTCPPPPAAAGPPWCCCFKAF